MLEDIGLLAELMVTVSVLELVSIVTVSYLEDDVQDHRSPILTL